MCYFQLIDNSFCAKETLNCLELQSFFVWLLICCSLHCLFVCFFTFTHSLTCLSACVSSCSFSIFSCLLLCSLLVHSMIHDLVECKLARFFINFLSLFRSSQRQWLQRQSPVSRNCQTVRCRFRNSWGSWCFQINLLDQTQSIFQNKL